jgi:hypothetical protein
MNFEFSTATALFLEQAQFRNWGKTFRMELASWLSRENQQTG